MPLNIVFLGASKLVSTKTLLLKHYCRRQGVGGAPKGAAKASCAETVVQKGVFGESVSTLPP